MEILRIIISLICVLTMISCSNPKLSKEQAQEAVLENMFTRCSVRSYTEKDVPDEMIQTILKAGMAAPSAVNFQPWEFVVIKNRATLDTLAGKLRYAKMLAGAPLAIAVCANTHMIDKEGVYRANDCWEHDASAATENILLAAHALGLGAVWTAANDEERATVVKSVLGVPEGFEPLCVISIGFPEGDNKPKDKWKPEKIHYEKW